MSAAKEILAVFARAPVLGRVKTRLSPPLTADEALALHRALVEDTLEALGRLERPAMSRLLLLSEPLKRATDLDVPREWSIGTQSSGQLGEKLASLFYTSFRRGVERVVVLGSDSPTLPLEAVGEAFERLASKDAVIGPAEDGGYYLLGTRVWIPELFQNVAWGSSKVLEQTLSKLQRTGRSHDLLVPWYDVDRAEDLERLREEVFYLERARPELVPRRVAQLLGRPSDLDDFQLGSELD